MRKPLSSARSKARSKKLSTKKTTAKQKTKSKNVQPTETSEKTIEQVTLDSSPRELEQEQSVQNIQKTHRKEKQTNSNMEETERSSAERVHLRYLEMPDLEQELFITQNLPIAGPSHDTDTEQLALPEHSDNEDNQYYQTDH